MTKLAPLALIGAFALGGCDVNVTSNDAATRNTINSLEQGAADLVDEAGNVAADAGNELGRAADAAGNGLDKVGDRLGDVDVDVDLGGGNKAR